MLGEEPVIPESLEVLEDGSAELGLVRGAEELPDVVHPDSGVLVLDELLQSTHDRSTELLDQSLVLPAGDLAGGLLRDDEVALLVHPQETCGGEVVDLDAGEACGVLVGSGESSDDDVRHGWITFRLGLVSVSPTLLSYQEPVGVARRVALRGSSPGVSEDRPRRHPYHTSSRGPLHG